MIFVRLILYVLLTVQLYAKSTHLDPKTSFKTSLPSGWTDLVDNYSKFTRKAILFGDYAITDWTPAIKKAIKDGKKYIYFKPGTYHVRGKRGEPAVFGDCVWVGSGPWEWPKNNIQTSVIAYTEVNPDGSTLKKSILDGAIKTKSTVGFMFSTNFRAKYIGFKLKTYHKNGFTSSPPAQSTVVRLQNTKEMRLKGNPSQDNNIFMGCSFDGSGLMKNLDKSNSDAGTDIYYEGNGGVFNELNFSGKGAGITLALPINIKQTSDFRLQGNNFYASAGDKIRITGAQQVRILVEGSVSTNGGPFLNLVSGGLINSKITKNKLDLSSSTKLNKDAAALIDANNCKINNTIISYNSALGFDRGLEQADQVSHPNPLHVMRFKKQSIIKGILIMANNLSFSSGSLIRFDSDDAKEIFVHSNILTSPGFNAKKPKILNENSVAVFMRRKQQSISFYGNQLESYYFDQSALKKSRQRSFLTNLSRRRQNKNASWVEVDRFNTDPKTSAYDVSIKNAPKWFTDESKSTSITAYSKFTTSVLLFNKRFIKDWSPAIKAAIKDGKTQIYFPAGTYDITGVNDGEPSFFGAPGKASLSWAGETDEMGTFRSRIVAHTRVQNDVSAWNIKKTKNFNGKPTKEIISTQSTIGFWFTSDIKARYLQFVLKAYHSNDYLEEPPQHATVLRIQKLHQWNAADHLKNQSEIIHTHLKHINLIGSGNLVDVNNQNSDGGTDIYFEGRSAIFEDIQFNGRGSGLTLAFSEHDFQDHDSIPNAIVLRNLHFDNFDNNKIRISGAGLLSGVLMDNFTATNEASKQNSSVIRLLGGGLKDSVISNIHMGKKPLLINANGSYKCQIWRTIIADSSTNKANLDDCLVSGMIPRYK